MRIRSGSGSGSCFSLLSGFGSCLSFNADPDPNFHDDADPDPDPDASFQIKAQNLEKSSNWLIFHTYIVACHLQIDANPDPDPAYHVDADADPELEEIQREVFFSTQAVMCDAKRWDVAA